METKLKVLLRDFGYEYQGNVLIEKGIRGFCSDRIVGRFSSMFAAADSLNPICGKDYVVRWVKITMPDEAKRIDRENVAAFEVQMQQASGKLFV